MRAMKCDRCGKFYDYYAGSKTFKDTEKANGIMLIDRDLKREYYERRTYDLCPECMREFKKFLENK